MQHMHRSLHSVHPISNFIFLLWTTLCVSFMGCDAPLPPAESGGVEGDATLDVDAEIRPFFDLEASDQEQPPVEDAGPDSPPEEESALCDPCGPDDDGEERPCPEGYLCAQSGALALCTIECDDASPCPDDYRCDTPEGEEDTDIRVCLPETDRCTPDLCRDEDGDGYGRGPDCLGLDCDEENIEIHEGVSSDECDGLDNDCDGFFDESFTPSACGQGACASMTACAEGRSSCVLVDPTGEDVNCDGIDEDCDGSVDEGYQSLSCGLGTCQQQSACSAGVESCTPLTAPIGDQDEVCDVIDSDCDGVIDEGYFGSICGLGVCAVPAMCTSEGILCMALDPLGADEDCNQRDDDCDGLTDEGFQSQLTCGFGLCERPQRCLGGQVSCVAGTPVESTDNNCDGVDDNCNGIIDEGCAENALGFELVERGLDFIEVRITLTRGQEMTLNTLSLPRLLDLQFSFPSTLTLSNSNITLGDVPQTLGVYERVFNLESRSGAAWLLFPTSPPNGYQYMTPGELMRLRFTHAPNLTGPFTFTWSPLETFVDANENGRYDQGESFTDHNMSGNWEMVLTPEEANNIVVLNDATLGGE